MPEPHTVYLAGELFNARQLAGNAALAGHIARLSGGRFHCVLPQDLSQAAGSPRDTRDQDLLALLSCDAAVFQYDGLELDSGTVVEFLFAKFADIAAVLLRTDFRHAGDQKEGDPWNLMNSFYPRTETVLLNAMALYQESPDGHAADSVLERAAIEVCAALDKVLAMPARLPRGIGPAVYDWIGQMPGFGNAEAAREEAARLYEKKIAAGLL